jgi:hypothetical protein
MNETVERDALIQAPSVGRRLWYWPSTAEVAALGMRVINAQQPFDAGLLFVWGLRDVNLQVTDHIGNVFAIKNAHLVQVEDEPRDPAKGFAMWMPHQQQKHREEQRPIAPWDRTAYEQYADSRPNLVGTYSRAPNRPSDDVSDLRADPGGINVIGDGATFAAAAAGPTTQAGAGMNPEELMRGSTQDDPQQAPGEGQAGQSATQDGGQQEQGGGDHA